MKIVALLSGLLASAFAWAAGIYVHDVSAEFLALWPQSVSLQFLGLVVWHGIVAAAALGGVLAVFSPLSGAVILAAVVAGWAWLAATLSIGFNPQMIVPIVLSGLGVLAAIGAMLRGRARRRAEHVPSREELEREEALRLEPDEGVLPTFDLSEGLKAEPRPEVSGVVPPPRPAWHDDGPPRGLSGLLAANVAVLILLAGAVGILLYSELRSGDLGAAFSPSGPRAAHVSEGLPRMAEAQSAPEAREEAAEITGDTMAADEPRPSGPAEDSGELAPIAPAIDSGTDGVPRLSDDDALAAAPPETGPGAADRTVETAALEGGEWSDPFSYCAAVGTVDFPDRRYAGPHLVSAVADALRVPASTTPDRARWRCFEGTVMGCASFDWPICAMTPSVPEMLEFCSKNPNARGLQAPNGSWACNGTRPEIPTGQNWPVDARGFLPTAWIAIPPASAG